MNNTANERPWEHLCAHGTVFKCNRCDLVGEIVAHVPENISELELMADVAEMAGYHATNVRDRLHGFCGYGALTFKIVRPPTKTTDYTERLGYITYPGNIIPHLAATNEARWPEKLKIYLAEEIDWKPGSPTPAIGTDKRHTFDQAVRRWCATSLDEQGVRVWIRSNSGLLEAMGIR